MSLSESGTHLPTQPEENVVEAEQVQVTPLESQDVHPNSSDWKRFMNSWRESSGEIVFLCYSSWLNEVRHIFRYLRFPM